MRRALPLACLLLAACPKGDDDAPDDTDTDTDGVDTDTDGDDTDTDVVDTDTDGTDTDTDTDTDEPVDTDVPDVPLVDCGVALPTPSQGTCGLTSDRGQALLVRGTILAPDTVYEGGSVLLDATGEITCVGCDCSADPAFGDARIVDCPGGVVSPALINPHDHLTFSDRWPLAPSSVRYEHRHDWRGSVSTPSNRYGTGSTSSGNRWVEVRQVMGGTTTMVGSGYAAGMIRNPDRGANEGAPLPDVENETFPLDDSNERFEADCGWDYRDDELAVSGMDAYVPHVAEGIDLYASEEFRCQRQSLDGGNDVTEPNTAHVHGIGLQAADYDEMASEDTVLIWSPRSNISLYGVTADVVTLHRLGGTVALGTDWTYTGSIHNGRELACADLLNRQYYDGWFSDVDLWRMVTVNAARSLRAEEVIGSLEPGLVGDITVFDVDDGRWHRAVIEAGPTDVALVLRGGVPLYGEADVVEGLDATCDTLTVCGADRAICTQREFGMSWASLQGAVPEAYPAFYCNDTPIDEPTCIPSRPGEFTGVATLDDPDGDGIPTPQDSCPAIFNPIRPIDGGRQPDADDDGRGDPCDPTPLGTDLDGDGADNATDNCIRDENADQADADSDGIGDACDACPDTPNPVGLCPAASFTIPQIRAGQADGLTVTVTGVTVTGVGDSGFTIQDPTVSGGANSGLYVFTGGAPSVSLSDEVTLQGTVDEYFGELQLGSATVVGATAGTPVAATPLTVAEAVTEPYEGVLVTLTDGAVTDAAYDCAVDGSCSDPGLWEVGGADGAVVYDRLYQDADWAAQTGTLPVTGVMGFRWERRRLMPRTAADFGP